MDLFFSWSYTDTGTFREAGVKRLAGYILAAVGGVGFLWCLVNYLGPQKGPVMGYDPVYAGLASLAVLTVGILATQNH